MLERLAISAAVVLVALGCLPVKAREPDAIKPKTIYQLGVASEAARMCRDLSVVDSDMQRRAYDDAHSNTMSQRLLVMGIDDFYKEFSSAKAKGRQNAVCEKYLRGFPSLLIRR